MNKCVTTPVDSSLTDLYTGFWSPSRVDLCRFKVSVLVTLEWDIKHFHVLGFLPIPIPPICALPLSCDPSPTTFKAFYFTTFLFLLIAMKQTISHYRNHSGSLWSVIQITWSSTSGPTMECDSDKTLFLKITEILGLFINGTNNPAWYSLSSEERRSSRTFSV
jgi:hypothetical protein